MSLAEFKAHEQEAKNKKPGGGKSALDAAVTDVKKHIKGQNDLFTDKWHSGWTKAADEFVELKDEQREIGEKLKQVKIKLVELYKKVKPQAGRLVDYRGVCVKQTESTSTAYKTAMRSLLEQNDNDMRELAETALHENTSSTEKIQIAETTQVSEPILGDRKNDDT